VKSEERRVKNSNALQLIKANS